MFLIDRFRRFGFRWWIDRIAEGHLQRCEFLKGLVPRPCVVKAFDSDRHDWYLHVDRQDRRPFLEDSRCAVNRALAFRIENQRHATPQTECAGAHSGYQICVRIEHDYFDGSRETAHDSLTKNVARAYRKKSPEH